MASGTLSKTCSLVALTAATLGFAAPAHALIARVFVSGKGADVGSCGSPTAPCRTFQYVHNNIVSAGGEIDVLDGANYGPLNITKSLSVINNGMGVASVQAPSGNAITINAGASGVVVLRGLELDGQGAATYGVYMQSGAALEISNCSARRFQTGFFVSASSGKMKISFTDVIASNNRGAGVSMSASQQIRGVLTRIQANNNNDGVTLWGPVSNVYVAMQDSVVSNNANNGVVSSSERGAPKPVVMLRRVVSMGNANGVAAYGGVVKIADSIVSANSTGVNMSDGQVVSLKGNTFQDNGAAVVGGTITPATPE